MRLIRGLYVIRSGGPASALAKQTRTEQSEAQSTTSDDGRLATLEVDFSRFDNWYRIDSWWEGSFMERTVRGAFTNTIARKRRSDGMYDVKVLFNHGFDVHGDQVLGVPEVLEERDDSPHLEAGLLDTSYNRDLLPGLRAGAYGSSFMFEVVEDSWNHEPEKSDTNCDGLPERTITRVNLFEAGPVTWPANPEATAGVRSGADWLASQLQQNDHNRYDELVRSYAAFRAYHGLRRTEEVPAPPRQEPGRTALVADEPACHADGVSAAQRARRLQLIDMARR